MAEQHAEAVAAIADRYAATLRAGGTLFFAGNGGSAADAQHLATEYVVRYQANRAPLRAIALTTDTSLLTACANDLGFDRSEEHTSELQSRLHLVCRLLLEKKKNLASTLRLHNVASPEHH